MQRIPAWKGRRAQQARAHIRDEGRRRNLPCSICKQAIDYSLEYPHPDSCSLQHVIPRSIRPDLTWNPANWAPAHLTCNKSQGVKMQLELGETSSRFT